MASFTEYNISKAHSYCTVYQYFTPFPVKEIPLYRQATTFYSLTSNEYLDCFHFCLVGIILLWMLTNFCMENTDFVFSFLLGGDLKVKVLGYVVSVYLTFQEIAKLFSKVAAPFPFPLAIDRVGKSSFTVVIQINNPIINK